MEGGGSQASESSRWGDYSMMSVDPTDDCTLWYTSEYYPATTGYEWHTRIGAFQFADCPSAPHGSLSGVVTDAETAQPLSGALVNLSGYIAFSDAAGQYQFVALPAGSYTLQASAYGHANGTAPVTISDGATTTQDIALTPLPATILPTATSVAGREAASPPPTTTPASTALPAPEGSQDPTALQAPTALSLIHISEPTRPY